MHYQHRLATLQDLPAIVAIYNSTVASRQVTADTEPVSVASRQTWFEQHRLDGPGAARPLWVVDDGAGNLLGWLSFSSFYGRPAYDGTVELSIYIAEQARGHGVGRYLLGQAIQVAPSLGMHSLLGFIFGHNQPSLALFAGFGFETWAKLPGVAILDGCARDLLIVGLKV